MIVFGMLLISQCPDRASRNQIRNQCKDADFSALLEQHGIQDGHAAFRHLFLREMDGGQRRVGKSGYRVVVKTDDADILWNPQSVLHGGLIHAIGQLSDGSV